MSLSVSIQVEGLAAAAGRLDALARVEMHELAFGLARLGRRQTQRRIETEKSSPEGQAWPKTREGRGALFVTGHHLYQSIQDHVSGLTASWGTSWIGARVHQFGAVIVPVRAKALAFRVGGKTIFRKKVTIPARAYLGISAANRAEIQSTATRFLERHVPGGG